MASRKMNEASTTTTGGYKAVSGKCDQRPAPPSERCVEAEEANVAADSTPTTHLEVEKDRPTCTARRDPRRSMLRSDGQVAKLKP
jgi:hypothetical protein